jgi:hypothetical protein
MTQAGVFGPYDPWLRDVYNYLSAYNDLTLLPAVARIGVFLSQSSPTVQVSELVEFT